MLQLGARNEFTVEDIENDFYYYLYTGELSAQLEQFTTWITQGRGADISNNFDKIINVLMDDDLLGEYQNLLPKQIIYQLLKCRNTFLG